MTTVGDIGRWMDLQAPLPLSEPWDNTGLLLGDPEAPVSRIQTCLTLTRETASEAVDQRANLVIVHHPLPFKPLTRITTESTVGRLIWQLAGSRIAVYSPHTAWDSASHGINAMLAQRLQLEEVQPLVRSLVAGHQELGAGRMGQIRRPTQLGEITHLLRTLLSGCRMRGVDSGKAIHRVAIACGSGGSLLDAAIKEQCDLFVTGEATFHTCLEARDANISLLMIGHFASERFSLVELASRLSIDFPHLECWPSQTESDPVILLE